MKKFSRISCILLSFLMLAGSFIGLKSSYSLNEQIQQVNAEGATRKGYFNVSETMIVNPGWGNANRFLIIKLAGTDYSSAGNSQAINYTKAVSEGIINFVDKVKFGKDKVSLTVVPSQVMFNLWGKGINIGICLSNLDDYHDIYISSGFKIPSYEYLSDTSGTVSPSYYESNLSYYFQDYTTEEHPADNYTPCNLISVTDLGNDVACPDLTGAAQAQFRGSGTLRIGLPSSITSGYTTLGNNVNCDRKIYIDPYNFLTKVYVQLYDNTVLTMEEIFGGTFRMHQWGEIGLFFSLKSQYSGNNTVDFLSKICTVVIPTGTEIPSFFGETTYVTNADYRFGLIDGSHYSGLVEGIDVLDHRKLNNGSEKHMNACFKMVSKGTCVPTVKTDGDQFNALWIGLSGADYSDAGANTSAWCIGWLTNTFCKIQINGVSIGMEYYFRGDSLCINKFERPSCFYIRPYKTGVSFDYRNLNSVTILKGCQFPAKDYGAKTTACEMQYYETAEDVTYVYANNTWNLLKKATFEGLTNEADIVGGKINMSQVPAVPLSEGKMGYWADSSNKPLNNTAVYGTSNIEFHAVYDNVEEVEISSVVGDLTKYNYGTNFIIYFAHDYSGTGYDDAHKVYGKETFIDHLFFYDADGTLVDVVGSPNNQRFAHNQSSLLLQLNSTDTAFNVVKKVTITAGATLVSNDKTKVYVLKNTVSFSRLNGNDAWCLNPPVEQGDATVTEGLHPTLGAADGSDVTKVNLWIDIDNYDFASPANHAYKPIYGKLFAEQYLHIYDENGAETNDYTVFGCYFGLKAGEGDYRKAFILQIDIDLDKYVAIIPQGSKIMSHAMAESGVGSYFVTDKAMVFKQESATSQGRSAETIESLMALSYRYEINDLTSEISNDEFRFKVGGSLVGMNLLTYFDTANVGIEVSDGTTTKTYTSLHDDDAAKYIILGLGAALTEGHTNVNFTVKTFVKDGDDKLYLTSKTYSIASMVKYYYEDLKIAEVEGLYNILFAD